MTVRVKLTIYDVRRCGYYRRGKWDHPYFGDIDSVLTDLAIWVTGQQMRQTQTFTPGEDEEDMHPVYCFDLAKSHSSRDVLLTTWNAVPMVEGGVPAARGNAHVGDVDVTLATVGVDDIPGYPTYFYFMPTEGLVVTVRPEGKTHNGHKGMVRYLQSFMTYCAPCVVIDDTEPDLDASVLGYKVPGEMIVRQLVPRFWSRIKRVPGKLDFLRAERARIRKVIRRDTLQTVVQVDRDLLAKLLVNIGLVNPTLPANRIKLGYDVDYTPSADELETIIAAAQVDYTDSSDVGFILRGDSETFWLSHSLLKEEFDLPVTPGDADVLPADQLLDALLQRREQIVAMAPSAGVQEQEDDLEDEAA